MADEIPAYQPTLRLEERPQDAELEAVAAAILNLDPNGGRFSSAVRRTIDMLLDGQHTGRFRWGQLFKTEKTHAGTLIEINLQREFVFGDGLRMDYKIAGCEVDCKFSQSRAGWMIPPEAVGELLLVVWASDEESLWSVGLVRALPELLNAGGNRDAKRTLNNRGRQAVRWLFRDAPLQQNILLRLPPGDIKAIFSSQSGQQRVDELFIRAQGVRISRAVVATVAMQEDYMKRVRYNGGSRSRLQHRGIVVLGHYANHNRVGRSLELPELRSGESMSARLVKWKPERGGRQWAELDGQRWTLAAQGDPEEPVPKLPEV
ncbi:MAG: restriction endonuclease [Amycolatopsis sp.]|uniref:NaeI family type II restriction endonuclease n=1 Tax=Amycolatopsis sp. TaxID=37632 RepID=UPI002602FF4C|nr:NaeI family type II restriction endonuclease [Amycolatopsis sp.]MCU1684634.1 restriction endonuclease [Amycolatopsis sp.]